MAGKRKTATKAEVYYIKSNPEGKDSQTLADEMSLFKETVDKILEESVEQEAAIKPNNMGNTIINRSDSGRSMAVMTPAGAERIDDMNRIARAKAKLPENTTGVTKTYPNGRPEGRR